MNLTTSHPIPLKDAGQWMTAIDAIDWVRRPKVGFDGQSWFPDGTLNTCFNAVDRHVISGRGAQAALIYDSPVSGQRKTYSFEQLQDETARLAGAICALGEVARYFRQVGG